MKQLKRHKLVTRSKPIVRVEPTIPKVRVEISGVNAATRDAVENAIVRALRNIASEPVSVKRVTYRVAERPRLSIWTLLTSRIVTTYPVHIALQHFLPI